MQIVSDPISETYRLIKKYDIHARKRFGQNFLTDARVLDKIINAADVTKDDFVLEIGPGLGTLTRVLCDHAKKVLAVELDYDLVSSKMKNPIIFDTKNIVKNCPEEIELFNYGNLYQI